MVIIRLLGQTLPVPLRCHNYVTIKSTYGNPSNRATNIS